jgi:hypothetical protein
MLKIFSLIFMALFSAVAFAHTGHDHGHWFSHFTHLVLAGAIVSVVVVAAYMFRRKAQLKRRK